MNKTCFNRVSKKRADLDVPSSSSSTSKSSSRSFTSHSSHSTTRHRNRSRCKFKNKKIIRSICFTTILTKLIKAPRDDRRKKSPSGLPVPKEVVINGVRYTIFVFE